MGALRLGPRAGTGLGHARFLALYLLCALGGSSLIYLVRANCRGGRSGAIFGLFGALFVLAASSASTSAACRLIVINLVLTVVVPGISWRATSAA